MEYTKDKEEFDKALKDAEASRKAFRTEHHLTLGDKVIYLTDDEIKEGQKRGEQELIERSAMMRKSAMQVVETIKSDPEALAALKEALKE